VDSVFEIKEKLLEQFATIGHALSSPKRLELLELLHQCEKCVETLAKNSTMSMANTSRHLQVLKSAGLVETRREGFHVFYRLADKQVHALVCSLKLVAEGRLADVERILSKLNQDLDGFDVIERDQLLPMAQAGEILILDIRPEDEYQAAHIPHAVSVPLAKLESYLDRLPRSQRIVAYCRGPYCVLASAAVNLLRNSGFNATRIREGIAEWKAAGLPVDSIVNPPQGESRSYAS